MSVKDSIFDMLCSKLSFSKNISFEWSIRIKKDSLETRDKFICWVNNKNNIAKKELEVLIEIIREYNLYSFLEKIPQESILNFGLGLCGNDIHSIYIHYLEGKVLKNRYMAFKDADTLEYEFYYLPITPNEELPRDFIPLGLLEVYDELIKNPRLNSMSGFWIRRNKDKVDQLSLTYPWNPPLKDFLNEIYLFCNKEIRQKLKEYRNDHIRHIAFNNLDIPSITIYFSGSMQKFPRSFEELRVFMRENAKKQNDIIESTIFKGISFANTKRSNYLDSFYSTDKLELWRKVLGENMYYHFGIFNEEDNLEDICSELPYIRAAEELTKFIDPRSSVYDMGCGWGGVSKYLAEEKQCSTVGITISKTQYKYCNSINVKCRYGDMENTVPPGIFDNLLLFESFEHVVDKYSLLKKLRIFGKRLIIRTSTQEKDVDNIVFGRSMLMISVDKLEKLLNETGWNIIHKENRRQESMPSIDIWNARMDSIPTQDDFHFEVWREYCKKIKRYKDEWAKAHPLIDIVAE
jgi:cyclopropane fatty-acyl-phospholipid synthase-like methyltransferase